MIVWRVEDDALTGPYCIGGEDLHDILREHHFSSPRCPPPMDDGRLRVALERKGIDTYREYSFGFSSLAQYKAWFHLSATRRELKHAGFKLMKYNVAPEDCIKGDSQVMYKPNNAQLIEIREC